MTTAPLVIAVDGPAGAGKSSVVQAVASTLGILYLDTGAMYRAATVGLLAAAIDLENAEAVAAWVCQRNIDFDANGAVRLDGAVVPKHTLRSPDTTRMIYRVADNPTCRDHLVRLQQGIVGDRDCALEGRDATTVICPEATLKIYLDASPAVRAQRRLTEWASSGPTPSLSELTAEITERDSRDRSRSVGALVVADDAVPVITDNLTQAEVTARLVALAVQRRPLVLETRVADQVIVGRSRKAGYVRVAQGSIAVPPAPWQLGLTNPSPDRLPGSITAFSCNRGGRQAGVLCQGQAVLALAGRGERPGPVVAMPMLPQTWYVIEPGSWHAVVQVPGTICAWAEASVINEQRHDLDAEQLSVLRAYLAIYLPSANN